MPVYAATEAGTVPELNNDYYYRPEIAFTANNYGRYGPYITITRTNNNTNNLGATPVMTTTEPEATTDVPDDTTDDQVTAEAVEFPDAVAEPETMLVWTRKPTEHNHVGQGQNNSGYGAHLRGTVSGYCEPCRYLAGLPPLTESRNTKEVPFDAGLGQIEDEKTPFRPGDFVRVGKNGIIRCVIYVNANAVEPNADGEMVGLKVHCLRPDGKQESTEASKLNLVPVERVDNAAQMIRDAMRLGQTRMDLLLNQARKRAIGHWRGQSSICTAGLQDWLASCEMPPLQQRMRTQVTMSGFHFEVPGCEGNNDRASARVHMAMSRAKLVLHEDDQDIRVIATGPLGWRDRVIAKFGEGFFDRNDTSANMRVIEHAMPRGGEADSNGDWNNSDWDSAMNYRRNIEHYGNRTNSFTFDGRTSARSRVAEVGTGTDAEQRNPFHVD